MKKVSFLAFRRKWFSLSVPEQKFELLLESSFN